MQSGYSDSLSAAELRASGALASVYAVRMLGLFMILPVFTLYAESLAHVTPVLVGLAIGIYGLTQALLQIPLGMLSDRMGRKPVMVAGLLVFAAGSVVAAVSDTIYGVIAGRALQGAGAIAAVVLALAADLTREEHRTKVMAIIGLTIGVSFSVAMVGGPVLDRWVGVSGIFWLTAVLAVLAIGITLMLVPTPVAARVHRDTQAVPGSFGTVLRDTQLLRLDAGIFVLHMVLTANFVVLPLLLRDGLGLESAIHWRVYLPVLLAGFLAMVPFIIYAEKYRRMKPVFVGAIAVLGLAQLALAANGGSMAWLVAALCVFFAAFNLLEASLPSLIAKMAPPDRKGTAMGVYSSTQFMGIFVGGVLGGMLHARVGIHGVFLLGAAGVLVWLVVAASMRRPRYLSSYVLHVGPRGPHEAETLAMKLTAVRGVSEAVVIAEEGMAYLKVERHALDEAALRRFSVA
ncbi:MFS transporter [Thioalkalivibrio thiocyanodenitrificans]|uniref:MFS transporter n=1 Tax=Thioalkalivibrio thiocyanodenitrificans TaxID=243063 RepID=UPI00036C4E55|nr:MFS transporter [Thioalkalivibrio thiocyanodenitrificans]